MTRWGFTNSWFACMVVLTCFPSVGRCTLEGQAQAIQLREELSIELPGDLNIIGAAVDSSGGLLAWDDRRLYERMSGRMWSEVLLGGGRPIAAGPTVHGWDVMIVESNEASILEIRHGGGVGEAPQTARIAPSRVPLTGEATPCGWVVHYRADSGEPVVELLDIHGIPVWNVGFPWIQDTPGETDLPDVLIASVDSGFVVLERRSPYRIARVDCAAPTTVFETRAPAPPSSGSWVALSVIATPGGFTTTLGDFTSARRILRRYSKSGIVVNELELSVPLALIDSHGRSVLAIRRTDRIEAVVYLVEYTGNIQEGLDKRN